MFSKGGRGNNPQISPLKFPYLRPICPQTLSAMTAGDWPTVSHEALTCFYKSPPASHFLSSSQQCHEAAGRLEKGEGWGLPFLEEERGTEVIKALPEVRRLREQQSRNQTDPCIPGSAPQPTLHFPGPQQPVSFLSTCLPLVFLRNLPSARSQHKNRLRGCIWCQRLGII